MAIVCNSSLIHICAKTCYVHYFICEYLFPHAQLSQQLRHVLFTLLESHPQLKALQQQLQLFMSMPTQLMMQNVMVQCTPGTTAITQQTVKQTLKQHLVCLQLVVVCIINDYRTNNLHLYVDISEFTWTVYASSYT